jgi:hypothetical protein
MEYVLYYIVQIWPLFLGILVWIPHHLFCFDIGNTGFPLLKFDIITLPPLATANNELKIKYIRKILHIGKIKLPNVFEGHHDGLYAKMYIYHLK